MFTQPVGAEHDFAVRTDVFKLARTVHNFTVYIFRVTLGLWIQRVNWETERSPEVGDLWRAGLGRRETQRKKQVA